MTGEWPSQTEASRFHRFGHTSAVSAARIHPTVGLGQLITIVQPDLSGGLPRIGRCILPSPGSRDWPEPWTRCGGVTDGIYLYDEFVPVPRPTDSAAVALAAPRLWSPSAGGGLVVEDPHPRGGSTVGRPTIGGVLLAASAGAPSETRLGGPYGDVTYGEVLDALELSCGALQTSVGGCPADLDALPVPESVEDLERLQVRLSCAADRFSRTAERLAFPEIPELVAEDMSAQGITATYPSYAGEYGTQVAELRRQMEAVGSSVRQVASTVRDFAGDISNARASEGIADLENEIREIGLMSQLISNAMRCMASAAPSVSGSAGGPSVSFNLGAIFVCIDAVAQSAFAMQVNDLQARRADLERRQLRTSLALQFGARMDSLADATRRLSDAYAGINGTLGRMRALRQSASESFDALRFRGNPGVLAEWELGRRLRVRHSETLRQYQEARAGATALARLARMAVEQRIGMPLSEMRTPMSLVPAPVEWVDTLCTREGVRFEEVWEEHPDASRAGARTVAEYVELLKLFVDSYMLDYPFQNGRDSVVVSYRDDIVPGQRTGCLEIGWNLLRNSEGLRGGLWSADCTGDELCPMPYPTGGNVLAAAGRSSDARASRALGGGTEVRLSAACGEIPLPPCGTSAASGTWGQEVEIERPGTHVLSWYERVAEAPSSSCSPGNELTWPSVGAPSVVVQVVPLEGSLPPSIGEPDFLTPAGDRWVDPCTHRRASVAVQLPVGRFWVGFGIDESLPLVDGQRQVRVGAVQLELSPDETVGPYFPADHNGASRVGVCAERSHGDLAEHFEYRCEDSCPRGFGPACSTEDGAPPETQTCFWESRFSISLDDLDRGALIPNGGFAHGNFNYRVDELALNLVGDGLRDCSLAVGASDACYASGFIPFSLRHDSGFTVRNHTGDEWGVPIFPGEIVFAKALAAERYITNPLSGTDRGLLSDYWRTEFRGRPLNGGYRLRIHDVPGFQWDRVEDIQIVLGYRYWTRQE